VWGGERMRAAPTELFELNDYVILNHRFSFFSGKKKKKSDGNIVLIGIVGVYDRLFHWQTGFFTGLRTDYR
jgi:hypothetical protein